MWMNRIERFYPESLIGVDNSFFIKKVYIDKRFPEDLSYQPDLIKTT